MGKSTRRQLKKATVRFYDGDLEIIAAHYPDIGYNVPVREYVHRLARRLEEGTNQRLAAADPQVEVDLSDLEKSSYDISPDGTYSTND